MDITQPAQNVAAPSSLGSSSGTTSAGEAGTTQISSDFKTFLKLLTTQIRNQDPMDPMKSEEFAVQLATFSNVEQQVKTNELLAKMAGVGAGGLSSASGWIGREVRASGALQFDGRSISLAPERAAAGNRHQLVVADRAGREVDRRIVDGQGTAFVYDGQRGDGSALPKGTYRFRMESFEDGDLVASTPVAGYARVVEVRSGATEPDIVLAGGQSVPMSEVTAVREAG